MTTRLAMNWRRRGIVLVTVLVLMSVVLTLFGIWGQAAVREHRRQDGQVWRMQAVRLAEAGLRRALARRAADARYDGETWSVPPSDLAGGHAVVRIRVTSGSASAAVRCEATAVFPAEGPRRAQITQHIEVPNFNSGEES